jgi:hypothetical protein
MGYTSCRHFKNQRLLSIGALHKEYGNKNFRPIVFGETFFFLISLRKGVLAKQRRSWS